MKQILHNTKIASRLGVFWLTLALITLMGMKGWGQATFTAKADANWNLSSTWTLTSGSDVDGIPDADDAVIIPTTFAITLSQSESCASLQINGENGAGNASSLAVSTYTLNVTGNISNTSGKSSSLTMTSGTLNIGGSISGLTTFTAGTGTVNYNGSTQTVGAYTYNNLTLSGSGTKTLGGITIVNSTLTIKGTATFALSTYTLGSPTSIALECGASGSTISGSGQLTLGGPVNVTYVATGSNGATISCPVALGATRTFTVADDGTSATDLTVSGIISGSFGITKAGTGTMTLSGASTYTGLTTISAGTLKLGAPGGVTNTPLGTTGAGTSVTLGAALDLNGFTLGTAEALTLNETGISSGGALTNSGGNCTYSGPITFATAASIVGEGGTIAITGTPVTGTTGITLGGSAGGSVSTVIAGARTLTKEGSGSWTLSGASTYSGLTTISSGTLKLGAPGGGTNTPLGTTGAGTSVTDGAALDLAGFTLGTSEALTLNGTGISNGGALMNSGAAATYSGLISLGSASSIVGGTGTINVSNAGTITGATFGLTLGGAQGGTLASILGTTSGALTKADAGTWTVSGASTYTGLTTISAGALKLGATGGGTNTPLGTTGAGTSVTSGAALDLNGFTLGTAEALTLNGTGISNGGALINSSATAAIFNGAITLASGSSIGTTGNITLGSNGITGGQDLSKVGSGTLNMGSGTVTLGGLTITAGILTSTTGNMNIAGNYINNGTFIHNSGTVTFNGTTVISGSATNSFNNVTITSGSSLTAPSGNMNVAGSWTNDEGTFSPGSGTVTFNGTGAQAINGTATTQTFNNIVINKTAGQTLTVGVSTTTLTVGGTFTQTQGNFTAPLTMSVAGLVTLTAGTFTSGANLSAAAGWLNNGATFTHSSGTVTFNGTGAQTIAGSASTSFNNLTIVNDNRTIGVNINTNFSGTLNLNGTQTLIPASTVVLNNSGAAGTITGTGTVQVTRESATADFASQYKFSTYTLDNLTVEYLSGVAQILSALPYGSLKINNAAGVTLTAGNASVSGTLTFSNGKITTSTNTLTLGASATVSGAGAGKYVYGNLAWAIPTGSPSRIFTIGDAGSYTPVTITLSGVTTGGTLTGFTTAGDHASIDLSDITKDKSVNRTWSFTNSGVDPATYDITLNYVTADNDPGTTPTSYIIGKLDGTTWSYPTISGTPTNTSISATGLSGFSTFLVGQAAAAPSCTVNPVNQTVCSGSATSFVGVATASPQPSVSWEYNDGVNGWQTLTIASPYSTTPTWDNASNTITSTLSISSSAGLNGYQYRVKFTNSKGNCTTTEATLTVTPLLSAVNITPIDAQTFCVGASGTQLTVAETGGGTTVRQWGKRSTPGGVITPISLATSSTYTPSGADLGAGTWYVVCTSTPTCGSPMVSSNEVTVNVNADLSLVNVTPAGNQSFCVGSSGSLLTAAETGGGVITGRQWYKRASAGGTNQILTGQTNPTYTPSGATLGAGLWWVVCESTPTCGSAVTSNEVQVTVLADGTWLGGTSGSETLWQTPTNWCGGTPTASIDAIIPNGTYLPVINAGITADCKDLYIKDGASVTITTTANDGASGSLIVSGSHITTPGNGGEVTYKRWTGVDRFYIVSSPVAGQSLGAYLTGGGSNTYGLDFSSPYYGMSEYTESSNRWSDYFTASTSGNFDAGKGYLIVRSNITNPLSFTGTINGDFSTSVYCTGQRFGWNAVGNPYTSALDIKTESTAGFIYANLAILEEDHAAVYLWYGAFTGNYYAINLSGYNNFYNYGSLGDAHVQAGQGFLINVKSPTTGGNEMVTRSLQFNKAMQAHRTATTLKKASVSWPGLTLLARYGEETTGTVVTFYNGMTTGLDVGYDAGTFPADGFQVFTHHVNGNNTQLVIQALPDNQYRQLVIPVGVSLPNGGEVSFSAAGIILPEGLYPMLEDRQLQLNTPLLSENDTYKVQLSSGNNSIGRFFLRVGGTTGAKMPGLQEVKFSAFTAGGAIQISGIFAEGSTTTLYDINGRQLGIYPMADRTRNQIPVSGLVKGIYLLRIKSGSYQEVIKVPVVR